MGALGQAFHAGWNQGMRECAILSNTLVSSSGLKRYTTLICLCYSSGAFVKRGLNSQTDPTISNRRFHRE
jgi:hypothetical protein